MANILLIYSTTDGHTREVCQALKRVISQENNQVMLVSIEDVSSLDVKFFEKVVVGASIRYAKHGRKVYDLGRVKGPDHLKEDSHLERHLFPNRTARSSRHRDAGNASYVVQSWPASFLESSHH